MLGKRESGTVHLKAAVAAYEEALEALIAAAEVYDAEKCRNNLERARALLIERQG
jgi:hypothetical protein